MTTTNPFRDACPSRSEARLSPPSDATRDEGLPKWNASDWRPLVAEFTRPNSWRAGWQLVTTLALYAATWVLLYFAIAVSWWLALPLVVLGSGLLVRTFIIFHDATHGSFFPSRRANDLVGGLTGVLTFTPYRHWRAEHAIHHGATGDLDRRGVGDVWTMTVREYLASSRWRRFAYRVARHPFALFVVAPFVLFFVLHRFARSSASDAERRSVRNTNLALFAMLCVMGTIFGFGPYLILQLAILMGAGAIGIWLFYMQHQFEEAYWERHEDWDYTVAALEGSSFLRLPKVLQWFSGNIGFHHIHHLSPRIPNYNLERCHASNTLFSSVRVMTFWSSFRSLRLRLWDEASKKLVSWGQLRRIRKAMAQAQVAAPNP
jgi:omega-6 fatty acid desaturase (delta-12 desaturase)